MYCCFTSVRIRMWGSLEFPIQRILAKWCCIMKCQGMKSGFWLRRRIIRWLDRSRICILTLHKLPIGTWWPVLPDKIYTWTIKMEMRTCQETWPYLMFCKESNLNLIVIFHYLEDNGTLRTNTIMFGACLGF